MACTILDENRAGSLSKLSENDVVTMYVTYEGNSQTRFDRAHWVDVHLPLVRECWGPHGLLSAAAFFPSGDGAGVIAICPCVFRDETAMTSALASTETKRVMDDVKKVTNVEPKRSLASPI